MRVLCAPDSFKGTIDAASVARALARGIRRVVPDAEIDICPVGDGGEGTLAALVEALGAQVERSRVSGPMGRPVEACSAVVPDRRLAIVELAQASGLMLVPPDTPDPLRATTLGTGQVIRHHLDAGAREIIVGVGGSATVDGGIGAIHAMGARLLDATDQPLTPPVAIDEIARIVPVETDARIIVACDVVNPLLGPEGAATVYGPQKGASADDVATLERWLGHLTSLSPGGRAIAARPGAGAAGGTSFGLACFAGAELRRGIDLVLEAVRFIDRCDAADLVITGEGRLDGQSMYGKAAMGVASAARERGCRVVGVVGAMGDGAEACIGSNGLDAAVALTDLVSGEEAMSNPAPVIEEAVARLLAD